MDSTVQVRDRGVLTLPAELREKYGIRSGDTFRLVDLDGIFVLTPVNHCQLKQAACASTRCQGASGRTR
jgi:AbrB family looped-hinge helix DNA binding protein